MHVGKYFTTFPSIQAPSGDVYAKPMKKKPTPDSEYPANVVQNDTYTNMQGWKKDFSCEIFKERFFLSDTRRSYSRSP